MANPDEIDGTKAGDLIDTTGGKAPLPAAPVLLLW